MTYAKTNPSRHVGKLKITGRLKNSLCGNPRFSVYVAGFHAVTKPNSSLAYGLTNHDGKRVEVVLGTFRGKTTVLELREVSA
jgi:hypothetical protein